MTKKKSTKSVLDSHAFKGIDNPKVTFPTTLPDYEGTPMVIEPKFRSHDQKVKAFLSQQFLNKNI